MFSPARYLGQIVPDLINDLVNLNPDELARLDQGQVELHSSISVDQSLVTRSSELLTTTLPHADLPADHPEVELPGVVLQELLGGGGQGWVYLGRVTATNKIVAVKVLRSDSPSSRRTAVREAALCSRVRHPNILRVFQNQSAGAFDIIIMELVQGKELNQGTLPAAQAKNCFSQLADALCLLKKEKIVHCDVKPANILLRHRDQSPVLIDFGVAQDITAPHPLPGLSGTPYFMAPDVFQENIPHPSWDAYSLGVTASAVLIGKERGYTSLMGISGEKISGKFDKKLRFRLEQIEDADVRRWITGLIATEKETRLAALEAGRQWTKLAAATVTSGKKPCSPVVRLP